jgi:hypothetical protein
MIQRGGGARFLLEAVQAFGVGGESGRQHLDRDVAAETRIPRSIDLALAACAKRRKDFIRTETGARVEGHWGFAAAIVAYPGVTGASARGASASACAWWAPTQCRQ